MRFGQLQGDDGALVSALVGMVDSGKLPHAIMIHEDDGCGAVPLAIAFLQYLYCHNRVAGSDSCGECPSCNRISKLIHPDVHFIFPTAASTTSLDYLAQWRNLVISEPYFTTARMLDELGLGGKPVMIGVAESKQLLSCLGLSALEGGYRSVVIYLPELMNQEASNRLLKIIEEPPSLTQFILVTHAPDKVLKTISSRCQCLRMKPRGEAEATEGDALSEQYGELFKALMDALLSRDLLAAVEAGENIATLPTRESLKAFCRYSVDRCRRIFLVQQGMGQLAGNDENVAQWAGKCRKTFPRKAMELFDGALAMITRNVNQKIVFTDLACKLHTIN